MKKSKEYIKNTIILFLGKFTTQFMSFLLLPLYTKKLLTEDYGTIDLVQSYISLLLPILTLRMDSASFRFLVDCRRDNEKLKACITNIIFVTIVLSIVPWIASFILLAIDLPVPYLALIGPNISILIISSIFLQILRGLGKTKYYSIVSAFTGITTLISNLILILRLERGADSILLSSIIANALCIVFVFFVVKVHRFFSIKSINGKKICQFLSYSIPLIPNALSWWVVNASDRTIIRIFLGAAFNGIYTVSCKFSNILSSVVSIFNMTWQETASLNIDDEDRDLFFTKMINGLFIMFSSVALCIMAVLPLFYTVLIGENYWDSYNYIPILLYASSWDVLVGLIGGIYVAKKRTKEIARTTIISAAINLSIDLVLVRYIGLYAAAISTACAYIITAILRMCSCQKYVKYEANIRYMVAFTIMFAVCGAFYLINDSVLNVMNLIVALMFVLIVNKENTSVIMSLFKNKFRKERK